MDSTVFAPGPLSAYPFKEHSTNSKPIHHHPTIDQCPISSTATLVGTDFDSAETKSEFIDKAIDHTFASPRPRPENLDPSVKTSDSLTVLQQRWSASRNVSTPYPKRTWATPLLEFLACLLWTSLPLVCGAAIYFSFKYMWYPMLAYLAWILVFDASTPFNGGSKRGRWFVRMPIWGYYRSYFSHRTILTPEAMAPGAFEAHEKYIFGYSPHGMYCLGAFASFCLPRRSDCPLPRNICLTTLGIGFFIPFFRELLYAYGFVGVGRKSIMAALNSVDASDGKPEKKAVLICIGGAREALWSSPDRLKLVMKKHKGFARLAIQSGAALVPLLCFGENNVYHQLPNPPGSLVRRIQEFVLRHFKFSPILFTGDTIFGYLIPRRKSLVTVVGGPIPSGPVDPNPSNERLDELHAQYMKQIQKIWDDYKDVYAADRKAEMQFVEKNWGKICLRIVSWIVCRGSILLRSRDLACS